MAHGLRMLLYKHEDWILDASTQKQDEYCPYTHLLLSFELRHDGFYPSCKQICIQTLKQNTEILFQVETLSQKNK